MDRHRALELLYTGIETILSPLVRVYLAFGGTYNQFDEIVKRVFISVADKHFKLPDRKLTDARISVVTGMSRKLVRAVANLEHKVETIDTRFGVGAVIDGWRNDPDFLSQNARPRRLTKLRVLGFDDLVQLCQLDTAADILMERLLDSNLVEDDDGLLELSSLQLSSQLPVSDANSQALIAKWISHPKFTDSWGKPNKLPVKGINGFYDLCKKYAGDIGENAVLDQLYYLGMCEDTEDGKIKLMSRGVIPRDFSPEQIGIGCTHVADLMNVVAHNILNPVGQRHQQLAVVARNVPQEYLHDMEIIGAQESDKFLRYMDEKYRTVDREENPAIEGTGSYRTGFGVYYFQEEVSAVNRK